MLMSDLEGGRGRGWGVHVLLKGCSLKISVEAVCSLSRKINVSLTIKIYHSLQVVKRTLERILRINPLCLHSIYISQMFKNIYLYIKKDYNKVSEYTK
ncbi:hypothetical protein GDO78_013398 [Eleutherodactylus coqui]|uniref:Uncharacterized protein n=1 Tax=Eleutherodactylus coqui TaxID=57060 RepID=A0A8J6K2C0_ELECQ|nr:hypothetical protein GDO78_013398 [Eleutherodactylus coqui]